MLPAPSSRAAIGNPTRKSFINFFPDSPVPVSGPDYV
jgi:hypothetical protein